jgi:hypothetical protein
MEVCVVEAGHDRAPLQINAPRVRAGEFFNIGRSADGDDALATNGDGFGGGPR